MVYRMFAFSRTLESRRYNWTGWSLSTRSWQHLRCLWAYRWSDEEFLSWFHYSVNQTSCKTWRYWEYEAGKEITSSTLVRDFNASYGAGYPSRLSTVWIASETTAQLESSSLWIFSLFRMSFENPLLMDKIASKLCAKATPTFRNTVESCEGRFDQSSGTPKTSHIWCVIDNYTYQLDRAEVERLAVSLPCARTTH